MAHATAQEEHAAGHPTPGTYAKIGFFIPLLLALSAVKFALVAMFYMHLKQDHRLFTGVFVFPLIIATIVILAMVVLMAYHWAFATGG